MVTMITHGCMEWNGLIFERLASTVDVGSHVLLLDNRSNQLHQCEVIQPLSKDVVHLVRFEDSHKESVEWNQQDNPMRMFTWTAKSERTTVVDAICRSVDDKPVTTSSLSQQVEVEEQRVRLCVELLSACSGESRTLQSLFAALKGFFNTFNS